MNDTLADGYRDAYREQYARAERLAAVCQQARELLQVAAEDSRLLGLELPDEVIALRRAIEDALAEEPTA